MPTMHAVRPSVLLAILVTMAGCSVGSYDKDYEARLRGFRGDAEFSTLAQPAESFAEHVRMRVPGGLSIPQANDGTNLRAKPPFLRDFPGYIAAYERMAVAGTTKLPEVLTVGVEPTARRRVADVEAMILEQVRREDSFTKAEWERGREVAPTAGGPAIWDVLSLDGDQVFEIEEGSNLVDKRLPGIGEIWVSADPKQEHAIVLAYRVPQELAEKLDVPPKQLVELMARTAEFVEPAAEPPQDRE